MVEKVLTINTSRFTKFKLVDIVPITTAVIGAISGSLGTALVNDWRKRKSERLATYEDLINRYLFQVQDTAESLWHRFDNIANMGGRVIMENGYYEKDTLYALGCLLAYKRILLLDGVYSHMAANQTEI